MGSDVLMQKVAEVAPEKFNFILKTANEVKASPFRDEILADLNTHMAKAAGFMGSMGQGAKGFGKAMAPGAAAMGGAVMTGIAVSLAGDMYDSLKRGINKSRNYKAMLRENQDLEELPADRVQKAFSALHRFNPEFAGDPTVAGSFVRRQAQLGEFDTHMLTNLVSARKSLSDIKKLPIPSGAYARPDGKLHRKWDDANKAIGDLDERMGNQGF